MRFSNDSESSLALRPFRSVLLCFEPPGVSGSAQKFLVRENQLDWASKSFRVFLETLAMSLRTVLSYLNKER